MNKLLNVIETAETLLTNRQNYAKAVLNGNQRWSGMDLRGNARKYSGGYYKQRLSAAKALQKAGGTLLPVEHGRIVTAVKVGTDDFGNQIYQTLEGVCIQRTAAQAKHL